MKPQAKRSRRTRVRKMRGKEKWKVLMCFGPDPKLGLLRGQIERDFLAGGGDTALLKR